jgi:uncharacterized protein (TIGR03083 family)
MESSRFLECLGRDFARIRAVVPGQLGQLGAAVPTCPGWTVADLARHVGTVYLHKVALMRDGRQPEVWPPAGVAEEDPVALLDRAYAELAGELTARSPGEIVGSWYGPDQSVGFWIRRMAQETVVHRIDAELGAGAPVAAVPDDLAIDGVDELLTVFVAFAMREWPQDFADEWPADATGAPGRPAERRYAISTDGASWQVSAGPGRFAVSGGPGVAADRASEPDVKVQGAPAALLRWAWNRTLPGAPDGLTVEGDRSALADFRQYAAIATQ